MHTVGETFPQVCLKAVDEENVIFSNYNKELFSTLKKYNVNCHVSKFRHRYFWDGGIHCSTADLDREGEEQDYFPGRGETGFNVFED